jgi:hypothetical protein
MISHIRGSKNSSGAPSMSASAKTSHNALARQQACVRAWGVCERERERERERKRERKKDFVCVCMDACSYVCYRYMYIYYIYLVYVYIVVQMYAWMHARMFVIYNYPT